jgi:spore maturation protein CgeB
MCAEIVLVGQTIAGSRTPQRARAFQALGHRVTMVPINRPGTTYEDRPSLMDRLRYRLRLPADPAGANEGLLRVAERGCDVAWIEAAPMITAATLRRLKALCPSVRLVWYAEDDMMNPVHRSRQLESALGLFDLWVTTKSFNTRADEMPSLGVRDPLFVDNSFDPDLHRPMDLSDEERRCFGADIAFVGTYEAPRARSLLALAQAGLMVRVWGNGWHGMAGAHPGLAVEDRPVYDADYARVVSASRINLGFLRKGNRDLQTCRTVEIPACGGFLLHERSPEAERLLAEGREAAFFSDDGELIAQCRRWLEDDSARLAAAAAGRRRMLADGHDHPTRLKTILGHLAGQEPPP